jgi:hypothetical protein
LHETQPTLPQQGPLIELDVKEEATRKEKIALQRLEVARTLIVAANRAFIVFFISLLLIWVQRVLPDYKQISEVTRAKDRYLLAQGSASRLLEFQGIPLNKTFIQLERDWQSRLEEAKNKTLKLPGGYDLEVPAYYSALIWSLICLTLFWYLNFSRRRHFSLMGRGLRVLRVDLNYSDLNLTDVCPGLPWWLIPLPNRDGDVITATQFRYATGWIAERKRTELLGAGALLMLVGFQLFTLWISWLAFSSLASQDKVAQFWFHEVTVGVLVLTLICVVDWLRPARVPDNLAVQANPNHWRRRDLILSAGSLLFTWLVFPSLNIAESLRKRSKNPAYAGKRVNPRFKRKKHRSQTVQQPASQRGLLNERTGVIHYVAQSRPQFCFHGLNDLRISTLKPVSFVDTVLHPPFESASNLPKDSSAVPIELPNSSSQPFSKRSLLEGNGRTNNSRKAPLRYRIHGDYASWATELEVEHILSEDKPRLAEVCSLLKKAIEIAPRSLRLYDRLAVICLQYNLVDQKRELIQFAEKRIALEPYQAKLYPGTSNDRSSLHPGSSAYGFWDNVIDRCLGRDSVNGGKAAHPKRHGREARSRCKSGKKSIVHHDHFEPTKLANALKRRVGAWSNPQSKWYVKWANKKVWQLPSAAQKCAPGKAASNHDGSRLLM